MILPRVMIGTTFGALRGLLIFCIFWGAAAEAGLGELLSQIPRDYSVFQGFKLKPSTCRNLLEPTREYILQLQNQGHELAIIMNNGSVIPLPKTRIRDDFNGVTYNNINDYIDALEDHVQRNRHGSTQSVEAIVNRCIKGYTSKSLPQSCLVKSNIKFLHTGFIILNKKIAAKPFVVHFYGDEVQGYFKGSIRVETLDSYLAESKMGLCETKIVVLKKSAQRKVVDFFKSDSAQRLVAKGERTFNLTSNPWETKTQNCNIWASELLASSLFVKQSGWNRTTREFSKHVLAETGFKPVKMALGPLFSMARYPALLVGGVDMEEGNFIHMDYNVGDIVPTESISEWLQSHGQISSTKIIKGSL